MKNYTIFRILLALGPLWYFVAVPSIFFLRSAYPFELEWMEGGTLIHLLRLQAGLPLYVAPSLEYVPFIYPPFYYYVSLGISQLTGLGGFFPLRLVSILSTAGSAFIITVLVQKQTQSRYWAFLSVGVFLATFRAGGAWFDIARVDMLFTVLLLAAIYAGTASDHWVSMVLAGLLLGLAFYTKQTALAYATFFICVSWFFRGWRFALIAGATFVFFAMFSFLIEDHISMGWYRYYIFTLPGNHKLYSPVWLLMLVQAYNIVYPLSISVVICLFGIVPYKKRLTGQVAFLVVCALGLVALSGASSLNVGAYANNYIPAFVGFSLLFGIGAFWLESRLLHFVNRSVPILMFYTACLLQFVLLYFNVSQQIPTAQDRRTGEQLVVQMRAVEGDVFAPYNVSLPILAGKPAFVHLVALMEIEGQFGDVRDPQWAFLKREFENDIQQRRFAALVLNHEYELWQQVDLFYSLAPLEYYTDKTFMPVTGTPTRPIGFWLPFP